MSLRSEWVTLQLMCVSSSAACRIKLRGYDPFIAQADSAVCSVRWRLFLNFVVFSGGTQTNRDSDGTSAGLGPSGILAFCFLRIRPSWFCHLFDLSVWQVPMEFGLDKRAQTLQGLAFPLQQEAKRALQQLKQRRINYIQLVRKPSYTSKRASHK